MSDNPPGPHLVVSEANDKQNGDIITIIDIVRGSLDTDTVLDEIDKASIRYLTKGTTGYGDSYTRYELTVTGTSIRSALVLDAIIGTLEGDNKRRRGCITRVAQLLP